MKNEYSTNPRDSWITKHDLVISDRNPNFDGTYKKVLDAFGISIKSLKDDKVLEVGVGKGSFLENSLWSGIKIIGFDIAPWFGIETSLRSYKMKGISDRMVCGDGNISLPFKSNSFDLLVSLYCLPLYSFDQQEALQFFFECQRVSKKTIIYPVNTSLSKTRITHYDPKQNSYFDFDLDKILDKNHKMKVEVLNPAYPNEVAIYLY